MAQIMVNETQTPDMFAMFRTTVAMIDEADKRGDDVTSGIGYATVDAILDASVNIVPQDVGNVLHRIGCVHTLLDTVYDRAFRGLEIDDVIDDMARLLAGAAEGLSMLHQVDIRSTRLDFLLPGARG